MSAPARNIRGVACTAVRSSPKPCAPRHCTVDDGLLPHSIRAYFIRRGDHHEPVRYEVDRIRNGRSFSTRRVVARQAIGAILNAESSFQRDETSAHVQSVEMPRCRGRRNSSRTRGAMHSAAPTSRPQAMGDRRRGRWPSRRLDAGERASSVIRTIDVAAGAPLLAGLPVRRPADRRGGPRPSLGTRRAIATRCSAPASTTRSGSTGDCAPTVGTCTTSPASTSWVDGDWRSGHVFADDGAHVATVAQEVLVRDPGDRPNDRLRLTPDLAGA